LGGGLDARASRATRPPRYARYSTIHKQDIKTAGGIAHAYYQVTTDGASTIHTVCGVAIDGNLMIGFAGISSATTVTTWSTQ
jgi:hypothetical protein